MSKTLIVTGGSSGIGFFIAQKFLKEGYRVINLSRRSLDLEGVLNFKIDLSNMENLKKVLNELIVLFPKKEEICLVHNAFFYASDALDTFDLEAVEASFRVSLLAPMLLNQELLPMMAPHSSIVFIGSTLSEKAVPHAMSYSTLKHGTLGLMRACVQDLKDYEKVHSVLVCPGFTRTPMLESHLKDPEVYKSITEKVLFKRLVEPSEIADLVFFSSQNEVLNGSVIHGNLGQLES